MSTLGACAAVGLTAAVLAFAAAGALDDDRKAEVAPPSSAPAVARAPTPEGRAVFARMGCGSCHRLAAAGSRGQIGPDLDVRLAHHTRNSLVARIVAPSDADNYGAMPSFAGRMTQRELDALVSFLLDAAPR